MGDSLFVSHSIMQGSYGPLIYGWGDFEVEVEAVPS